MATNDDIWFEEKSYLVWLYIASHKLRSSCNNSHIVLEDKHEVAYGWVKSSEDAACPNPCVFCAEAEAWVKFRYAWLVLTSDEFEATRNKNEFLKYLSTTISNSGQNRKEPSDWHRVRSALAYDDIKAAKAEAARLEACEAWIKFAESLEFQADSWADATKVQRAALRVARASGTQDIYDPLKYVTSCKNSEKYLRVEAWKAWERAGDLATDKFAETKVAEAKAKTTKFEEAVVWAEAKAKAEAARAKTAEAKAKAAEARAKAAEAKAKAADARAKAVDAKAGAKAEAIKARAAKAVAAYKETNRSPNNTQHETLNNNEGSVGAAMSESDANAALATANAAYYSASTALDEARWPFAEAKAEFRRTVRRDSHSTSEWSAARHAVRDAESVFDAAMVAMRRTRTACYYAEAEVALAEASTATESWTKAQVAFANANTEADKAEAETTLNNAALVNAAAAANAKSALRLAKAKTKADEAWAKAKKEE
jgi:hypothetical protein